MNTFQILTLIISFLIPLSLIIGIYVNIRIKLAALEILIQGCKTELIQQEAARLRLEKNVRDDRILIQEKLDTILLRLPKDDKK